MFKAQICNFNKNNFTYKKYTRNDNLESTCRKLKEKYRAHHKNDNYLGHITQFEAL